MIRPLSRIEQQIKEMEERRRVIDDELAQLLQRRKQEARENDVRLRHHAGGLLLRWAAEDTTLLNRIRHELPALLTKEDQRRGIWHRLFDDEVPEAAKSAAEAGICAAANGDEASGPAQARPAGAPAPQDGPSHDALELTPSVDDLRGEDERGRDGQVPSSDPS